jgi:4-alpha-glucanotransferase
VTQKASPTDPTDVYRTENAAREDWVMLGNHDTPAIRTVIATWSSALREQWCRHLAARLRLADPARLVDDRFVATCMLAELFLSRAENVSIFFVDLFGYTERYNIPGVIDPANWTLRLDADFEQRRGLDLPLAIDLALSAQSS